MVFKDKLVPRESVGTPVPLVLRVSKGPSVPSEREALRVHWVRQDRQDSKEIKEQLVLRAQLVPLARKDLKEK
jgi:hypothetical protein